MLPLSYTYIFFSIYMFPHLIEQKDTTKKVGEMSRSCEIPRSKPTLQEEDDEALLPNFETLNCELEGLRLSSSSEQGPQKEYLDALMLRADLLEGELERLQDLKEFGPESTGQEMLTSSYFNLNEEAMREMLSSCRSELRRLKPDGEALLLEAESLKSELERLQILNERFDGECLDSLSHTELRSLESQLRHGLNRVKYLVKKKTIEQEEDEKRLVKQDEDTDTRKQLIKRKMDQEAKRQFLASKGRKLKRQRVREERSSSEGRQDWDDHLTLLRSIEWMKWEIQELQLWNGRMCGREVDGLEYYELMILQKDILWGLCELWPWIGRKRRQEEATLGRPVLKETNKMRGEEEHGGEL